MTTFQRGDFVVVVTINEGQKVYRERVERTWAARILGPSAFAEGWWLVRAVDPKTGRVHVGGSPITVPESEMSKP